MLFRALRSGSVMCVFLVIACFPASSELAASNLNQLIRVNCSMQVSGGGD